MSLKARKGAKQREKQDAVGTQDENQVYGEIGISSWS